MKYEPANQSFYTSLKDGGHKDPGERSPAEDLLPELCDDVTLSSLNVQKCGEGGFCVNMHCSIALFILFDIFGCLPGGLGRGD